MDNRSLVKRAEKFVANKRNHPYAIQLVNELYKSLTQVNAENAALQRENDVLEHQLATAEKYMLG